MLPVALSLLAPDIEALLQGITIVAQPRLFLQPDRTFWLYPFTPDTDNVANDDYYKPSFLKTLKPLKNNPQSILIQGVARCTYCEIIETSKDLEIISHLTVWTQKGLEKALEQRKLLFLAYLRVYRLSEPIEILPHPQAKENLGKFINLSPNLSAHNLWDNPVLSDNIFRRRCQQLQTRTPPINSPLEDLYTALNECKKTPAREALQQDITAFLDGLNSPPPKFLQPQWIKEIAQVGNSSDGHRFEKLVRKSLGFLGFRNNSSNPKMSLNPEATGGAGGLDFCCQTPYLVVGECKATKTDKVPDSTPAQLIKLGNKFLKKEFNNSIKIIVIAGKLTDDAQETASNTQINVMRPETLERLVQLKAKYPGSINLMELKSYLEKEPFGEKSDEKINEYIDQVEKEIEVRSVIVKLIKKANKSVNLDYLEGRYDASEPSQQLTPAEMQLILIELSSPLAGYLGREEGDKFYFIRDLDAP